MALQTPSTTQGKVRSAGAATEDGNLFEFLKTLRKDLVDLRNAVDALTTAFNGHTHFYDSTANDDGNTSGPDSTAATTGNTVVAALVADAPPTIAATE